MSTGLVSLDHEPRHTVDAFVDELIGRARLVILHMGRELEEMLREMITALRTFQEAHYLITLKDVRFEETSWLKESGQLALRLGLGSAPPPHGLRHVVVDKFVDAVVGRSVPEEFRDECSAFLRALVMQFSMIAENGLNLAGITFDRPTWYGNRLMLITIRHNKRPLLPRDAGV